ncbi:uncharacterized protein [Macrobrachium rosenbergii]|uniref:uncharacterized protein n=1 Tax=Macrobrachium rosenbergii TaxID=79674 RepID=UPI0034D51198
MTLTQSTNPAICFLFGREVSASIREALEKCPVAMVVWITLPALLGFVPLVFCNPVPQNATRPADVIAGNYQSWKSSATEVGVVIVGGGVAGLTAAKVLLENSVTDILLLEADSRVGGRIRTHQEGDQLTEEGPECIEGGPLNPLFQLALEMGELATDLPEPEWDTRVMSTEGHAEDASHYDVLRGLLAELESKDFLLQHENRSVGDVLTERFRETYKDWDSDEGKAWLHTLGKFTNVKIGTGNWNSVAVGDRLSHVSLGDSHYWKNGFDTLITHFTNSIPEGIIRTSTPANKIFWDDGGRVLLVTNNGRKSFLAKHIIVTVTVGYLKEKHQTLFQPPLPVTFTNDLNNVEVAVSNKVQMGWSEPWWGSNDPLSLVLLWRNFNLPKEMEWLYGVVLIRSLEQQTNVLQAHVVGDEAALMEELPEDAVKEHFLHLLRKSTGLPVPIPTFFKRTMLGRDPWMRGSRGAHITVEGFRNGLDKRERLAAPLVNSRGNKVVLWAGEHTHNTRYSTVDGAMASGEGAAKEMVEILKKHPADILMGSYTTWNSSAIDVGVVIVGAGVAGLSAAKTLLENNITDILILEADHRIGGRVRTYREGDILVEEGAEWVHGNETNPLHQIAKYLGALSPYEPYYLRKSRLATNDGQRINASTFELLDLVLEGSEDEPNRDVLEYLNRSLGEYYTDQFHDKFQTHFPTTVGLNVSLSEAWLRFLELMVSYEWGFDSWMDISMGSAMQYELYGDQNHHWKNGYDTFINYLKTSIPDDIIETSSPVSKIFWDEESENNSRVLVVAENGRASYAARHVIVTTSIGHLQERHQTLFHPPLPASYTKNFEGIYLAVADKIMIGWPEPWWGSQESLFFFILWTNQTLPKEMDWLYGITCIFTIHQQPSILEIFVTADSARRMEVLPEGVARQHVLHLLRSYSGLPVPEPTFFKRSKWGLDPWKRGSYCSLVTIEAEQAGFQNRQEFTTPLTNSKGVEVVLWAGEHTHDTRYCTVDGAMETGEREARNLLEILKETTSTTLAPKDDQGTTAPSA